MPQFQQQIEGVDDRKQQKERDRKDPKERDRKDDAAAASLVCLLCEDYAGGRPELRMPCCDQGPLHRYCAVRNQRSHGHLVRLLTLRLW